MARSPWWLRCILEECISPFTILQYNALLGGVVLPFPSFRYGVHQLAYGGSHLVVVPTSSPISVAVIQMLSDIRYADTERGEHFCPPTMKDLLR